MEDSAQCTDLASHTHDAGVAVDTELNAICRLAALTFGTDYSFISFLDHEQQRYAGCQGLSIRYLPKDETFCAVASQQMQGETLVVLDAENDARFARLPAVVGPPCIRFYAGVRIPSESPSRAATICIADPRSRPHFAADEQRRLGDLAALVGIVLDSRRHRVEAKRSRAESEENERRFRLIADNTSDIIVTADLNLVRTYVSPAVRAVLGYEPDEFINKPIRDFIHADDAHLILGPMLQAQTGATFSQTETVRYRHKQAHYVWLEVCVRLARDPSDGALLGYVATLRDVTDRQRAARALELAKTVAEQAARQKAEFVANMSHELRTPLTGILGVHDLLRTDPALSPTLKHYLTLAQEAGRALLSIVDDVLDFSKIDAGLLTVETVCFDPLALIQACHELAAEQAQRKGLVLETVVPVTLRPLLGDPMRLRQILNNLLVNAIKFTHAGRVTITARYVAEPPLFRVEVTDTGIGIPGDKLNLVFGRFSQADASTTRRYGGTGLGLAICRQLTELMGGAIGVVSTPNQGSTFWLDLPLALAPSAENGAEPVGNARVDGGTRVLLAEDNAMNQEIIAALLRSRGYHVTSVADGSSAVAAARATPYDVILMDLQMPVMDGFMAAKTIRSATKGCCRRTPIVALTANAMPEDVQRCLEAGMVAHVAKPIEWSRLNATLENVLAPHAKLRPDHWLG